VDYIKIISLKPKNDLKVDAEWISNLPEDVTVDSEFISGSTNPVRSQVIQEALDNTIPLSGTVVGKPVTGVVKFEIPDGPSVEINTTQYDGEIKLKGNDFTSSSGNTLSIGSYGLSFSGDTPASFANNIIVNQNTGFLLSSNHDDSKGLVADKYYGANYDDNTYVQKKYVDDKIKPIIFSDTTPTTEIDGSALIVGVSRWCDTTDNTLYNWVGNGGNPIWLNI